MDEEKEAAVQSQKDSRTGRFLPGNTLGKYSTKERRDAETRKILHGATPDACRKIVELLSSKNDKIAMQAAREILDRVWGKPVQSVQADIATAVTPSVLLETLRMRATITEVAAAGAPDPAAVTAGEGNEAGAVGSAVHNVLVGTLPSENWDSVPLPHGMEVSE